jgi:hypothetical protein
MKELAEVKSSVLQLHKGAEKRLEAFIQVANDFMVFHASASCLWTSHRIILHRFAAIILQRVQAEHREWDQMLGSPSPKKMIGNGHLPDIHNKDVRNITFSSRTICLRLCVIFLFNFLDSFQGSPKKGADAKKAAQPAAKKLKQAK